MSQSSPPFALSAAVPASFVVDGAVEAHQAPALLSPDQQAGLLRSWLAALDQVGLAMLLLQAQGRVMHANRQARQHCQDSTVVCLAGRHLRLARAADAAQFERALAQAGMGRRSLLMLGGDGAREAAALQPITGAVGAGVPWVLVLLSGREPINALSLRLFAELHRLTKAEHKVLRELALGLSPKEVADLAGVALTTVRSQIQAIRDKTAARTLRELLQRVACLPPMLPPDVGHQPALPVSLAAAE